MNEDRCCGVSDEGPPRSCTFLQEDYIRILTTKMLTVHGPPLRGTWVGLVNKIRIASDTWLYGLTGGSALWAKWQLLTVIWVLAKWPSVFFQQWQLHYTFELIHVITLPVHCYTILYIYVYIHYYTILWHLHYMHYEWSWNRQKWINIE